MCHFHFWAVCRYINLSVKYLCLKDSCVFLKTTDSWRLRMSINKTQVPLILGVIYRFSKWILQQLMTFYNPLLLEPYPCPWPFGNWVVFEHVPFRGSFFIRRSLWACKGELRSCFVCMLGLRSPVPLFPGVWSWGATRQNCSSTRGVFMWV